MALEGFVKLHRKLIEWGWYSDCVVKDVFLHILITARFHDGQYMGYEVKRGQAVIGRKAMARDLGFSEQQIRTALKKLESTGEISLFSTNRFTIATVENWASYQGKDWDSNQQSTNNQPTDNQQITNNQPHLKNDKNDKNDKKNNIIRHKYGRYDNVLLSDTDYEKLVNEFPMDYQDRIEALSEYMKYKGKSYKDHLATIRSWARREQKQQKSEQKGRNDWINEL